MTRDVSNHKFGELAVAKGWINAKQLKDALQFQVNEARADRKHRLGEICLAKGYLDRKQVFSLMGLQGKTRRVCLGCGFRMNLRGAWPGRRFACPHCKQEMKELVNSKDIGADHSHFIPPKRQRELLKEAGIEPGLLPSPKPRQAIPSKPAFHDEPLHTLPGGISPRVWIIGGSSAAAVLFFILVFSLMGGDEPVQVVTPPPGSASVVDSSLEQALRKDWVRASTSMEALKNDPLPWKEVVRIFQDIARRGVGTSFEDRALKNIDDIKSWAPDRAVEAEREILTVLYRKIHANEFRQASIMISEKLEDPNITFSSKGSMRQFQLDILQAATEEYEKLLASARKYAMAGDPEQGTRLLKTQTGKWAIARIQERAGKDSLALYDLVPRPAEQSTPAQPRENNRGLTRKENIEKLYNDLIKEIWNLEKEGKIRSAIERGKMFPIKYRDTEYWDYIRKELERLEGAMKEEEREGTSQKPAPRSKTKVKLFAREPGPRTYQPGDLDEASEREVHRKLSQQLKKDRARAGEAALRQHTAKMQKREQSYGIYDVATLVDRGDGSKRVDIVIVTSGFPRKDEKKVNQMALQLQASLLKVEPFRNYPSYINVHRVNVDDASPLQAHVSFQVNGNILTCDRAKAREYAKQAPDADLVVVLCNVSDVRATGGSGVITIDASMGMGQTFLHEMGHAFAGLADEYADDSVAGGFPLFEEENSEGVANVTRVGDVNRVKWHYWTRDVWPAPHQANNLPSGHRVGVYEGAYYREKGVWRPEGDCLMREGNKYCLVCFEHVEKRFYRLMAPIDNATPDEVALGLWRDEAKTFSAEAISTQGSGRRIGMFQGIWYLDGKEVPGSRAKNLTIERDLKGEDLQPGMHELGLRVDFSNARVRRDHGWLSSSRGWMVSVSKYSAPLFSGPLEVEGKTGAPIEFEVKVNNPDENEFWMEVHDLPRGASIQDGRFHWIPETDAKGAWRCRFVLTNGLHKVEKIVRISVRRTASKNYAPLVPELGEQVGVEGKKMTVSLGVVDVDGDNLLFTASNLPRGAVLDPYAGVLQWTPTSSQAGDYRNIAVEVWDGFHSVNTSLHLQIDNGPEDGGSHFEVLQLLRSSHPGERKEGLENLASYPRSFVLLEATRLLRDRYPEVRKAALTQLENLASYEKGMWNGMILHDVTPHTWHFTEDKAALSWLQGLAENAPSSNPDARALVRHLKGIHQYNRSRGVSPR